MSDIGKLESDIHNIKSEISSMRKLMAEVIKVQTNQEHFKNSIQTINKSILNLYDRVNNLDKIVARMAGASGVNEWIVRSVIAGVCTVAGGIVMTYFKP